MRSTGRAKYASLVLPLMVIWPLPGFTKRDGVLARAGGVGAAEIIDLRSRATASWVWPGRMPVSWPVTQGLALYRS